MIRSIPKCVSFSVARTGESSSSTTTARRRRGDGSPTADDERRRLPRVVEAEDRGATNRRTALERSFLVLSGAGAVVVSSATATADDDDVDRVLLRGTVTLPTDASTTTTTAALYVTARPDRADDVPRAVLDGSRGKPPPVLVARFAAPLSFPFEFALTGRDATEEGRGLWWCDRGDASSGGGLVVSARLDADGVAATRDPNDLVGRTVVRPRADAGAAASDGSTPFGAANVELQGRGVTGKLLTSKKK